MYMKIIMIVYYLGQHTALTLKAWKLNTYTYKYYNTDDLW